MLDARCSMLDARCRRGSMLDARACLLSGPRCVAHGSRVLAPNSGTETLVKLPKIQESGPTGGRGDGFGLVSQK